MYKLHSLCFPVKGYNRSIIYDFLHGDYFFIPNSLCELLGKPSSMLNLKNSGNTKNKAQIQEYVDFLLNKNVLMTTNRIDSKNFTSIPLEKEQCNPLMILDITLHSRYSTLLLEEIKKFIIETRTQNIGIQYFGNNLKIQKHLKIMHGTYVNNVELYLQYPDFKEISIIDEIVFKNPQISKTIVLSAPKEDTQYIDNAKQIPIIYTKQQSINNPTNSICEVFNLDFFIESQSYNTFYNRRLRINEYGDISLHKDQKSIFKIGNCNKKDILSDYTINAYWKANKNIIQTCQDCEFRNMCYDARLPVKEDNHWRYESNCTYNPYICKWEGQEGYVPVEECGNYSRETGFVPNHEMIEELNKQIWGDDV